MPKCSHGCRHPCAYQWSSDVVTKDWCVVTHDWCAGRDPQVYDPLTYCAEPCSCSDIYWDDLIVAINDPVEVYENQLRFALLVAKTPGMPLDPGTEAILLDKPFKIDLEETVEHCYWHAFRDAAGDDPALVKVYDLPPCMHGMYANIDQIFADWDADLAEIRRLCDEKPISQEQEMTGSLDPFEK
jgi:hypothetical protein